MSKRSHSDLRLLALAYYRGWVGRDRYLDLRSAFLQAINAGVTPEHLDENQLKPTGLAGSDEVTARFDEIDVTNTTTTLKTGKRDKNTIIVGSLILAILVVVIVIMSMDSGTENSTETITPTVTAVQESGTGIETEENTSMMPGTEAGTVIETEVEDKAADLPEPAPVQPAPEEALIVQLDNLLQTPPWDSATLEGVKNSWQNLTNSEQSHIKESSSFQLFTSALVEQIADERGKDNVVPSDTEMALMTLAKYMDVMHLVPK